MKGENFYDRILGCLVAAGMGDAIGAPSEAMSIDEIEKRFGGPIKGFVSNSQNYYSKNNSLGEATDDTSQMYEMAKAVAACHGDLTVDAAARALVRWADDFPQYYPSHAGPTTRIVIEALRQGGDPVAVGKEGGIYARGSSNGAAMRIAAAGLVHPGNLDGAVETAMAMTAPSHGTQHGYSGACAIACGIAAALDSQSLDEVLSACIYGAQKGESLGSAAGRNTYGLRVPILVERAISIAKSESDGRAFLSRIGGEVGCDVSVQCSVGAAVGLFAFAKGGIMRTILLGANLGGDTDTIACIAGMLAGAYSGFASIPADQYAVFEAGNPSLDFASVAKDLAEIAEERRPRR